MPSSCKCLMILFIVLLFQQRSHRDPQALEIPTFFTRHKNQQSKLDSSTTDDKNVFNDKLLLVQVVFRHGARSPLASFPTNTINYTESWPRGLGQLTPGGEMHGEELGKFLRDRYQKHLKDTYDPNEIRAVSSDVDRTIMTGLGVLQGLYPSKGSFWSPIPQRTISSKLDNVIQFSAECPRYHEEMYHHRHFGEGRELDIKHERFYCFLSNHTGIPAEKINLDVVGSIYDTLYIQHYHKMIMPDWASHALPWQTNHTMRAIAEYAQVSLIHNSKTMKLRGGPILREIMKNFKDYKKMSKNKDSGNAFKMYLYSGHDTTVAALMHALGVHDGKLVPFTGALILEFWKRSSILPKDIVNENQCPWGQKVNANDLYYLKVFYRQCIDKPRSPPLELIIPDCGHESNINSEHNICDIRNLILLKADLLRNDWASQCLERRNAWGQLEVVDCEGFSTILHSLLRLYYQLIEIIRSMVRRILQSTTTETGFRKCQ